MRLCRDMHSALSQARFFLKQSESSEKRPDSRIARFRALVQRWVCVLEWSSIAGG